LGGLIGPLTPFIRLEAAYFLSQARTAIRQFSNTTIRNEPIGSETPAKTVQFTPILSPDGSIIEPIDRDFGLVVPKIGINASVIPEVDPADPGQYEEALKNGVAHSSASFFPDEHGTVYLFSHSTNYEWFVKDVNAVFYLVKNLEQGDEVIIFYKGDEYTYRITGKKVVSPRDISYLVPNTGKQQLILQTCWPPGSIAKRLLIFADLIEKPTEQI